MTLHLINDTAFSDCAINQFLEKDKSSRFLLVTQTSLAVKYIKNMEKVQLVLENSIEFDEFMESLNAYTAIVLHGLFYSWQEKIIKSVSSGVKIAWIFFGAEIYGRPDIRLSFLAPETSLLYRFKKIKRLIKGAYFKDKPFYVDQSIFDRIDYCLTDEHEEFEFVKEYTNSEMKELWYMYYTIEETLGELKDSNLSGNNILVGNSCTLENNHLDAFKMLRKFDLMNRKLIVPLSYGENWLKSTILRKGKKFFGDSFSPLLDFKDHLAYNRYLISCSIVVMNQYRPQAQGNIITSLWLGAKVYLSKRSIAYAYFQRIGICIFSIEDDLHPSNRMALEPLGFKDAKKNKQVLMREYGRDTILDKVGKIAGVLNNKKACLDLSE